MTYARMKTLRTPKHLTGLDYGMPSLTFQVGGHPFNRRQLCSKTFDRNAPPSTSLH